MTPQTHSMGHPLETTFSEENKHCLVCHDKKAIAVYHAVDDLVKGPFGGIEVTCQNKGCMAILYIPRLASPVINPLKDRDPPVENW